jgi:cell wall-associated NlpC family hydrolase
MADPDIKIKKPHRRAHVIILMLCGVLLLLGCGPGPAPTDYAREYGRKRLGQVRFAIQVGAFANLDNAVRLTENLQQNGLNAYHFIDASGLYKVRFGNYSTRKTARREAEILQSRGVIDDYYVVSPQLAAVAIDLQTALVKTAQSFLGIPYKWGGESPEEGFDCSGLTMTVYQLNGLDLPRTSRQQWAAGNPVRRRELERGDLIFFATSGGNRVSHVGIYAGKNRFIHAPGRGKKIRTASLASAYYRRRYLGARRYM